MARPSWPKCANASRQRQESVRRPTDELSAIRPALTDLASIVDYLSDLNPNAAHRVVDQLEERWELLVTQPRSGRLRADLGFDLREVIVGEYLSIYQLDGDDIEIVRILHGRRNITSDDV